MPETVIHIGGRVVSKNWLKFLAKCSATRLYHVPGKLGRVDPLHQQVECIDGTITSVCQGLQLRKPSSADFAGAWQAAHEPVMQAMLGVLDQEAGLSEPLVARMIAERGPSPSGLFLGNSMPIRDVDRYGFWSDQNVTVARIVGRVASMG